MGTSWFAELRLGSPGPLAPGRLPERIAARGRELQLGAGCGLAAPRPGRPGHAGLGSSGLGSDDRAFVVD